MLTGRTASVEFIGSSSSMEIRAITAQVVFIIPVRYFLRVLLHSVKSQKYLSMFLFVVKSSFSFRVFH